MTPAQEIDYILDECFLGVGQAVGTCHTVELDTVVWWRTRYRRAFLHAMTANGNSWMKDRRRVMAVGRFLGQRAIHHVSGRTTIGLSAAALASTDVETGCRMNAEREGLAPARCTNTAVPAF